MVSRGRDPTEKRGPKRSGFGRSGGGGGGGRGLKVRSGNVFRHPRPPNKTIAHTPRLNCQVFRAIEIEGSKSFPSFPGRRVLPHLYTRVVNG